ncbi:MAG: pyridoxal phosphate-dependent aminotransferase [Ruminococcus sp.]|jgi:threonine-phosphate decarboxylase
MKEQIHGGDIYRHPQVLDFSSNINPLGTPQRVIDAAAESLKRLANYPDIEYTELKKALAEYENQPESFIICGNGAAELIFSLVLALRPQKAVVPAPTFAEYRQALEVTDCEIITYPMKNLYPGEDMFSYLKEDVDMLFLCNPNNPTGFLMELPFLKRILDFCGKQGIFLVVDECFLDFVDGGEEYSLKNVIRDNHQLFLLKAFTKRYAMAGIRLGYGICSSEKVLSSMSRVTQPWNVSIPAQAAGIAALKEKEYVKEAQDIVRQERTYLKREMKRLGLQVFDSQANYIFFRGPEDLYENCLKEGILIRDCSNYSGLDRGYFRTAVKNHRENTQLIAVLEKIL